jgi:hypothetical protein
MSYMEFKKVNNLLWKTKSPLRHNSSMVDMRFLQSKYPNAEIHILPQLSDYYLIWIEFSTEADEAEFIMRESL